jgi:hypothetical protein
VVETFRRTIAIDSENVPAHHGLGQAYAELAKGDEGSRAERDLPTPPTESIRGYTLHAIDPKVPIAERAFSARRLSRAVTSLVSGPRQEFGSRLNPLHEVVETLGPAFWVETEPKVRTALAGALSTTHKALHSMFKPDETAEGRAVGIARKANPAADMNAQSIVIHPLHRPGAPGIEASTDKVASREGK